MRYGAKGVLAGLEAVKSKGSPYTPKLAEFIGLCLSGFNADKGSGGYGAWETCPYTGRKRRLRPERDGEMTALASRLGDGVTDKRDHEEIRLDIEAYIANGQSIEDPIQHGQTNEA